MSRAGPPLELTEYEQEHGPLPEQSRQRARQFLAEAGLPDEAPRQAS